MTYDNVHANNESKTPRKYTSINKSPNNGLLCTNKDQGFKNDVISNIYLKSKHRIVCVHKKQGELGLWDGIFASNH